jgi:hypothetical protein
MLIILIIALVCMGTALGYIYMLYQQCKSGPQSEKIDVKIKQESPDREKEYRNIDNQKRDRQVIEDPLYPPLNRDHSSTPQIFYQRTRKEDDRYRLVAYMVAQEDPSDTWKLFARDTGRGRANFYMMPSDKNSDIKVSLETPQLRDIYDIPRSLNVSSPVLRHTSYQIMELQKSDMDSPYY